MKLIPTVLFKFPRRTFNPLKDEIEILRKLEEVAEELEDDMAGKGWAGRTVTLKFKRSTYEGEEWTGSSHIASSDTAFALVCTRSKAMNHWVAKKDDLFNVSPIVF